MKRLLTWLRANPIVALVVVAQLVFDVWVIRVAANNDYTLGYLTDRLDRAADNIESIKLHLNLP